MKKIQFGQELVLTEEDKNILLRYYLLESPVGFGYSKLKSYGIEIKKTDRFPGRCDMSECKQIEGIFFDVEEAITFLAKIKKEKVLPTQLSVVLEKFIHDKIKAERNKCKKVQISE